MQSFIGIRVDMHVCENLLEHALPALHSHMSEIAPPELFIQGPLQTLLVSEVPPGIVFRLFDMMFLHSVYSRCLPLKKLPLVGVRCVPT